MKKGNKRYFAIDLFAGSGGLSEGFRQAGFEVIAQVEMDRWACQTLKTRCLYYKLKERKKLYWYFKYLKGEVTKDEIYKRFPDIKKEVDLEVIKAEFGEDDLKEILNRIEDVKKYYEASTVHVVLGGPPCQPYSLVGRSRDPNRMMLDERHFLYEYYLEILKTLQPDFFIFENVPGLITAKARGEEMFSKMIEDFRSIYPSYEIAPSFDEYSRNPGQYLLNSAMYGVPQKRRRIVFIGYRKSLLSKNSDVKDVFKKVLKSKVPEYAGYTVSDAIGDLPALALGKGSDGWFGEYHTEAITPYQRKVRSCSPGIVNHRTRTHMKSDLERYRFFIEHRLNGNKAATLSDLMRERPDLTPAHNHLDKFLDRFKVQWWSQPSSTITAHICKDGHYYIHPDISQCRSFTVREAARCQSFPDNFKFEGPRTEQFKQVGNAVPPLLSRTIARCILQELKRIHENQVIQ